MSLFRFLNREYLSNSLENEVFELCNILVGKIGDKSNYPSFRTQFNLIAKLFEENQNDDFFIHNFHKFLQNLDSKVKQRLLDEIGLTETEIEWNEEVRDFLIKNEGLNERFVLNKKEISHKRKKNIEYFEKPPFTFKKLKAYQAEIYFKVFPYICETNYAKCIIQMPTGSGKTRTAMEIICEFLNHSNKSVLWLANTEELCYQAYESFKEVWWFLRKKKLQVINHHKFKGAFDKNIQSFHVATLQSFNSSNKEQKIDQFYNQGDLGLIIVDEAHISIAKTYKETISKFVKQGVKLIGLTATPGRSLKNLKGSFKDQNKSLSDFYNNKLFSIDSAESSAIDFLRKQGILSNASYHSIEGVTIDTIFKEKDIDRFNKFGLYPKEVIDTLVNDVNRNTSIFLKLEALLKEGKKILFFGTSILHSKLITNLLKIAGYKAAHLDSNSGGKRREIIASFKESGSGYQVLCNYGILSTGFDDPKIDVVFMARPTKSIVLYSQIIGRGLRGPIIGGTDHCEIYTVQDNIAQLPDNDGIYSYFDSYFINK